MGHLRRNDQNRVFANGQLLVVLKYDPAFAFNEIDENMGVTASRSFQVMILRMRVETDMRYIQGFYQWMIRDMFQKHKRKHKNLLRFDPFGFVFRLHPFYEICSASLCTCDT